VAAVDARHPTGWLRRRNNDLPPVMLGLSRFEGNDTGLRPSMTDTLVAITLQCTNFNGSALAALRCIAEVFRVVPRTDIESTTRPACNLL
jgi:hypothetical protein